jgi:hypothetical protein
MRKDLGAAVLVLTMSAERRPDEALPKMASSAAT